FGSVFGLGFVFGLGLVWRLGAGFGSGFGSGFVSGRGAGFGSGLVSGLASGFAGRVPSRFALGSVSRGAGSRPFGPLPAAGVLLAGPSSGAFFCVMPGSVFGISGAAGGA